MNERDRGTFEAFASRFAAIEAVIPDRPTRTTRTRSFLGRGALGPPVALALTAILVGSVLGVRLIFAPGATPQPETGLAQPSLAAPPSGSPVPVPSPEPSADVALVPLDPAVPAATLPPPCLGHYGTYDRLITTPGHDAARSTSVVIGRVSRVGHAQWNTPDGRPPESPADYPTVFDVMRFVRIDVETNVRGLAMPAVITVWVIGGTIGCDSFVMGGTPVVEVGDRLILFLNGEAPQPGTAGVVHAWQLWSITDDVVATEYTGGMPLTQVLEQIKASAPPPGAP